MQNRNFRLWFVAALVYAFLYIPLVIVVAYSFNDSRLNTEWVGFTLFWYEALFNNKEMLTAARNSLIIAVSASICATVLGTMAGLAIHRYKLKVLPILVFTPVAMPEILLGVSLLLFFSASTSPDAWHGFHHYCAHHILYRLRSHHRTGAAARHGLECL